MGESDAAPWAPPALRSLFASAKLDERCDGQHPPRVVLVGGDMWIAACGFDRVPCSIGAAKPLEIDPGCLVPASALRVARALGADRWGAVMALDVPGIVGFAGAFQAASARAVIAVLESSAERYRAELERVAGRV